MAFNPAQYQATVNHLSTGITNLSAKLDSIPHKAQESADRWWIPQPAAEAILWCGRKLCEIGSWILNTINECMQGVIAPLYMFNYAYDWQTIRGVASGVSGEVQPQILGSTENWKGAAADAYTKGISPQAGAASSIATIANTTSNSLYLCAGAGLVFYLGIAAVVIKFILVLTASIIALMSGAFSWAGLIAAIEAAGVTVAMIVAAITAVSTLLTAQATQMGALHGVGSDNSAFPGGHWPTAAKIA